MKNLKTLNPFLTQKRGNGALIALAAGSVILSGLVASLFLTETGRKTRKRFVNAGKQLFDNSKRNIEASRKKLSQVVSDVREHIRTNAESLVGSELEKAYAAEIHPKHTPTSSWKNPRKKIVYPESTFPPN